MLTRNRTKRLKADNPLDSDMNVYADRQHVARGLLQFTFKDTVISGADTPKSVSLYTLHAFHAPNMANSGRCSWI